MSTTTPNGVTITATKPDGTTVDVTEHVSAIYDLVIGSLDFGSGFLSYEDAVPLAELARLCGFEDSEEAERYLRNEIHRREQTEYFKTHPESADYWTRSDPRSEHEHVWSSVGECLYRMCGVTRETTPTS